RPPTPPTRRVMTSPERTVHCRSNTTCAGGIAAPAFALITAGIVLTVLSRRHAAAAKQPDPPSTPSIGAEEPLRPNPAPVPLSPERERALQARYAQLVPEIGLKLDQQRFTDAAAAADAFLADAQGTPIEGQARDLRDRVRKEPR